MKNKKIFSCLWKAFIWLDYIIRYRKFPKFIELTDRKDIVRINGIRCGFYSKEYMHHESCGNPYYED